MLRTSSRTLVPGDDRVSELAEHLRPTEVHPGSGEPFMRVLQITSSPSVSTHFRAFPPTKPTEDEYEIDDDGIEHFIRKRTRKEMAALMVQYRVESAEWIRTMGRVDVLGGVTIEGVFATERGDTATGYYTGPNRWSWTQWECRS